MAKTKSFGTTVTVGGTAIGGLTNISRSGADRNFPDITTHDSAGGYKEYTTGLKDGGTCELSGMFDATNAGQDLLRAGSDAVQACVITLPSGTTISFSGFIQPPNEEVPLDDAVTFSASIKITGAITYSAS